MKLTRKQIYIIFVSLIGLSYGGWLYWSIQEGRFQSPKKLSSPTPQKSNEEIPSEPSQHQQDEETTGKTSEQNPLDLEVPKLPEGQLKLFKKRFQKLQKIRELKNSRGPLQPKTFEEVLQLVQDMLPTKSEVRELKSHQVHTTPPSLRLAGKAFGEIKGVLKEQPELETEAESFYTTCSNNQELMDTVRALCLTNKALLYRQRGEELNMQSYPANLRRLAKEILQLE